MESAREETNLMFVDWSNQGVNLWEVKSATVSLVAGTSQYTAPTNIVSLLDVYVSNTSSGSPIDYILLPVSRTEYASYPNKVQRGRPSVYWYNRQIASVMNLYMVPDGTSVQTMTYYYVSQIQDADFAGAQTADLPYRWLSAFRDGLAYRLALVWKPELAAGRGILADKSFNIAAAQDIEQQTSLYISPGLSSYYR
jgi:hypothetical protein